MTLKSRIALAIAATMLWPLAASAADYDPPIVIDEAPEYVPVEVGSGWYLRGDVGYSINKPYEFFDGPTGFISSQNPLSGSIGAGYHVTDYLRAELNFGILPTSKFSNDYLTVCGGTETTTVTDDITGSVVSQNSAAGTRPCAGSDYGKNKAYSLMANAYVDLGTYVGFTPYIGGGLGVAYSTYSAIAGERNCQNGTSSSNGGGQTTTVDFNCNAVGGYGGVRVAEREYNLAYSVGAGFAYRVSQNASVDVGYEYFAIPDAKYAAFESGGVSIKKGIDYHQVKVGLRYDLW
ncbi:outer membrane beta-barrel protein [Aminobacter aminovorans]|uniref:outer membrane protein n=1 Tax=Aminobacter aminovorans TaxID=83263 RepID=UPI00285BD9AB|nr:outer membrane beta-barrel protein [Aminobacter aminovorans]MDR7221503.1 opacity protein-like surface antigen [Aminobacter aminovorans]